MARKFYWPSSLAEQLVLMQNFSVKIGGYAAALGLAPAQVTAAEALCEAFIGSVNFTEQCKTTMQAMTQWRDAILYGDPFALPMPQAPVFPVLGSVTYPLAVVKSFMKLRDRIVAASGYTAAIGEDLGIIGAESAKPDVEGLVPELKAETSTGFWVNLSGSMRGMDALKVEYSRNGNDFQTVAFLTNTPGGFQITPTNPAVPEKGFLRAVYIKKNEAVGGYSANYAVTLS